MKPINTSEELEQCFKNGEYKNFNILKEVNVLCPKQLDNINTWRIAHDIRLTSPIRMALNINHANIFYVEHGTYLTANVSTSAEFYNCHLSYIHIRDCDVSKIKLTKIRNSCIVLENCHGRNPDLMDNIRGCDVFITNCRLAGQCISNCNRVYFQTTHDIANHVYNCINCEYK